MVAPNFTFPKNVTQERYVWIYSYAEGRPFPIAYQIVRTEHFGLENAFFSTFLTGSEANDMVF